MASPQHIATSSPASTVFYGGIETDKARPTDDSISASAGKVNDLRDIFSGNGTPEDPFRVEYLPNDPQDATTFSTTKKWLITTHQAVATLAVTFASSAYSGAVNDITKYFEVSHEVATLGVSLYVLGFAIGPLLWAPISELYGRQQILINTLMAITAFNAGAAGVNTMPALLVLRFFAGATGSSTLNIAGGVIADMFNASERGPATSLFAMAPFLGPAIGECIIFISSLDVSSYETQVRLSVGSSVRQKAGVGFMA